MTTGKNTNSSSLMTSCSFSLISLCHHAIMHRRGMSSPHFKLFSSKIPDPQVHLWWLSAGFKTLLFWAFIILVVSVFGLISLHPTGFQLPFWFSNLFVTVSKILINFSWRHLTKPQCLRLELITQYDHGIQDQTESRDSLRSSLLGMENTHL